MRRILFLLVILFAVSCTKESEELSFDTTPKIELLSISNDTIVEFQESISFSIRYEDGDGDLGNPDPNVNSLFVKDSRLQNEDAFYVQPLAPVGEQISITGNLTIELASTFILGNADSEFVTFTIYMLDRNGNKSNVIETETITIVK